MRPCPGDPTPTARTRDRVSFSARRAERQRAAVAAISATAGVTWFVAWFISDARGPRWLHTLSLPAALLFGRPQHPKPVLARIGRLLQRRASRNDFAFAHVQRS